MGKNSLILPRTYDNPSGSDKFKKFEGLPKVSYSQIDSWKNPKYKGDYIQSYFLGIRDGGNIFTDFGSLVGEWFENGEDLQGKLSESDLEALSKIGRPENCEYEREVVVERDGYVFQGYIDRSRRLDTNKIEIVDFKTGNIETKKSYYAGDEYQQTTLYTKGLLNEGEEVDSAGVIMLGRKGNGSEKHPLRLTGEVEFIDTPYSENRINNFLDKADKIVEEISDYYKFYKKYFDIKK